MKKKWGKKASLQDALIIGIILLVFAFMVLITFKITSEFNDQVSSIEGIPSEAVVASQRVTDTYTGIVDNSFLFLTIGLALVSIIMAALVRVHPIFIPIFIIGLVFLVFFAGIFSNIYQEAASSAALQAEADQLVLISLIMNILPVFTAIIGTIIMIVLYKTRDYVT